MEELKELIRVSLSGRVSGIEFFNQHLTNKKSLAFKLFHHISSGKINSDAEAKDVLYGKDYSGFKYNMLKERFREKLYTNLLFLQPRNKDTKSYPHNVFYCFKHYVVARLLLMVAAKNAGRSLMIKVLNKARKFQITEVAMLASSSLRRQAFQIGSIKDFDKYSSLFTYLSEVLKAENEAEAMHDRIMLSFEKAQSGKNSLIPVIDGAFTTIKSLKETFNTFYLNLVFFQVCVLKLEVIHDYETQLNKTFEFEEYLRSQPNFYSDVRHANILIIRLYCYLFLEKYDEGIKIAKKSLNMYDSVGGNKLFLQEMIFLLALRSENYVVATETFNSVIFLFKNYNVDEHQKEIWRIYHGFLWICLSINDLNNLLNELPKSKRLFSISKVFNETIFYSKDKEGINLTLRFLQLMILIHKKEFGKVIDKIENLKSYINRNIGKQKGARDYLFLKLFLLLPKNNFDPLLIKDKSKPLIKKLQTLPKRESSYYKSHIEVISYEKMWNMILKML